MGLLNSTAIDETLRKGGMSYLDSHHYGILVSAANDEQISKFDPHVVGQKEALAEYNRSLHGEINGIEHNGSRINPHKKPDGATSNSDRQTRQIYAQMALNDTLSNALGNFLTNFSLNDLATSSDNCKKLAQQVIDEHVDKIAENNPEINSPKQREEITNNLAEVINLGAKASQYAEREAGNNNPGIPSCNTQQMIKGIDAEEKGSTYFGDVCMPDQKSLDNFFNDAGTSVQQTTSGATVITVSEDFPVKNMAILSLEVRTLTMDELELKQPANKIALEAPSP